MSRELLFSVTKKDLRITAVRGSGPGGQHRNKAHTGIRIEHPASGAVGEATDSRSQKQNREEAFKRMCATTKFRMWQAEMVMSVTTGKTVEQRVEESMIPANIKTEVHDEQGRWVEEA